MAGSVRPSPPGKAPGAASWRRGDVDGPWLGCRAMRRGRHRSCAADPAAPQDHSLVTARPPALDMDSQSPSQAGGLVGPRRTIQASVAILIASGTGCPHHSVIRPFNGKLRRVPTAAGGYRALGETEHVGTQGVLSALASLGRREYAIGVDLPLEAAKEGFTGWPGAGVAVSGPAPRDVGGHLLVDVFHGRCITSSVFAWVVGGSSPWSRWVAGISASAERKWLPMRADAREACACACGSALTERHPLGGRRARIRASSGRPGRHWRGCGAGREPTVGSCW